MLGISDEDAVLLGNSEYEAPVELIAVEDVVSDISKLLEVWTEESSVLELAVVEYSDENRVDEKRVAFEEATSEDSVDTDSTLLDDCRLVDVAVNTDSDDESSLDVLSVVFDIGILLGDDTGGGSVSDATVILDCSTLIMLDDGMVLEAVAEDDSKEDVSEVLELSKAVVFSAEDSSEDEATVVEGSVLDISMLLVASTVLDCTKLGSSELFEGWMLLDIPALLYASVLDDATDDSVLLVSTLLDIMRLDSGALIDCDEI